ncbi:cytochrome c-type biogenesis protein CcmH [Polymorphobacter multimanifer]|uniref:Cytochrome c-type biogenesis protein n=1 Tax=Polymorphobacter multimanifer TaxID=1070431 RepID=A0A841LDT3_9SPHN|nr:cytochrome c-type biogenesis protein [Polymorphobacter multimanifer]MBB6227138.1 cytochrome c-type biogenesis protein CcmH [Polymorphobacter multimanifer]
MRALLIAALLLASPALAVLPDEMLPDPAQEARAREISKELRCVVCQNQSIDDSDAPLAKDLRVVVREQISMGRTNPEIIAYVSDRYGDFVLLRPPVKPSTWLLWAGPFILLLAGAGGLIAWRRPRSSSSPVAPLDAPLSAEEAKAVAALGDPKS